MPSAGPNSGGGSQRSSVCGASSADPCGVQSGAAGDGAGAACDARPARIEPVNSGGRSLVAGSSNMLVCVGPESPQILRAFWRGTTRLAFDSFALRCRVEPGG